MAHIIMTADYYKPEDVQRLVQLSKGDANFRILDDTEWETTDGKQIISSVEIRRIENQKMFKKYNQEIKNAVASTFNYEENYEELMKERKEIKWEKSS